MNNEQITKAKIQLILTEPFFATIALGLKYEANEAIKTGCVDGITMQFNPQWIEKLTADKVKGFIAHEVMHVAGCHHTRKNGRDHEKWNIACDYAINQILVDCGFVLPDGGLLDAKYKGMAAEEIYNLLPMSNPDQDKDQDESEESKGSGSGGSGLSNDPGKDGSVKDAPAKTQSEMQSIEAETKQLIAQAKAIAERQGKLPDHLKRMIEETLQARADWKAILSAFLTEVSRNDYTFSRPSKRYISQGLYLPSLQSTEKGKFILVVDTSGSIDNELLNLFAGEMQGILGDCAESITVMYVDHELDEKSIQEFESDDEMILAPTGGRLTDFKPAFAYIEKNQIETAALIYFTDGHCNSFPSDPGFPVLWAVYNNKRFAGPLGETIHI